MIGKTLRRHWIATAAGIAVSIALAAAGVALVVAYTNASRERMRAELSKSGPGQFDLKQDRGGITDIEFLAQYWTLHWAERYPELVTYSDNIRQLESLASADLVPQATVDVLTHAYRVYRQRMHHLSLEAASNVVSDDEFRETRAAVTAIWNATM